MKTSVGSRHGTHPLENEGVDTTLLHDEILAELDLVVGLDRGNNHSGHVGVSSPMGNTRLDDHHHCGAMKLMNEAENHHPC